MVDTGGQVPALNVLTQPLDSIRPLVPLVDPRNPLVFSRRGQGIAGVGEALRLEFTGPNRMVDAAAAWKRVAAAATVEDPLGLPGTGLVAFGAFSFSDDSAATSVLIVPSVVIGRRDGTSWITRISTGSTEATPPKTPLSTPIGAEYRISLRPGALTPAGYLDAVNSAVGRIRAGDVSKVVLARDLIGHLPIGADLRLVVAELALGYPDCYTFAVDGLIGSSPETLVRADNGTVSARVLAGSTARGADALADQEAAVALATSTKDQDEHEYALQSLLTSLRPHSRNVTTSELPFTLKLPNLWHLASDVEGTLTDGSTSLDLIAALHPTAAVAGTPTRTALDLISELEPFDRGRYAGPVGWVGADGDGEWAVALRCAEVSVDGDITAYAGAGIVAESDAEMELAETKMKFRPVVEAFS
ncbi:isochorismate synthase [Glaciihabitans tibetensis]|uniref:isochorismate synthase n=1 Tax=Glaciihabitans tibetensis TaxID=1266600 RepID=A0A2T0VA63_9MICO|nr:isochorismate synthase [Glaciihabitans tibetensis]PRY67041.1 isochorismate synthase [Glaciihabitans tibetensis]